jgi:hypothetical protein
MDGVLAATNEQGHLTYPMLHLAKEDIPEDGEGWEALAHMANEQGWDNVLVFAEGKVHFPDGETVYIEVPGETVYVEVPIGGDLTIIELNDGNGYERTYGVESESAWTVSAVNASQISVSPTTGTGNRTLTIKKAESLEASGTYTSAFVVTDAANVIVGAVIVRVVIPTKTLEVRYGTTDDYISAPNGGVLTIVLASPNYTTQKLTVAAEGAWSIDGVETSKLYLYPTSGSGQITLSSFYKQSNFTPSADGTSETGFWVRSGEQSVHVIVKFTERVTGKFVDPPDGIGVPGTETPDQAPVYIYI